jgi:outer membrane protein assembly factor BamB
MWRYDSTHSASVQSGPSTLNLKWSFATGGAVVSSPSIADGRIYFGSHDKNIYCLNARTGSFIWKFQTGDRIKSSPAIVDGRVYVGPDDGKIYCISAEEGSLVWSRNAGGTIQVDFGAAPALRSSPTVVEGRVYVGSLDTNVYCLYANDGSIAWRYKTEGYITSSPAVADGAVYIVSQEPNSGSLYKLNAVDGSFIWKKELPYEEILTGGNDLHASPTVADGLIFASSNVKEYYGINTGTGNIEWTYRTSGAGEFIVCSPVYNNGQLFIVDHYSIVCVDAKSGEPVWSTYLGEELYVSPSYAGGKLYVVTDQRSVYVLNATDGKKLSAFSTDSNSWSSPTIGEGRVYVGNNDWKVYCLADSPTATSNITIELVKHQATVGESVAGFGSLSPAYPGETILVYLVKPDNSSTDLQVVTSGKGAFNFAFTPEVAGSWTVVAQWESDKSYYASAYSVAVFMDVTATPEHQPAVEYIYAVAITLVVLSTVLLGYAYVKRTKK